MISPGELYEMEDEVGRADDVRLREMSRELIYECHRLRHLIEEMAQFRSSLDHDRVMKKLNEIEKLAKS